MRYVTVKKFSSESGYTEAAIRSKIADGTWEKDYVWRKAPDGRVLIDVDGYEAWVEMGAPSQADRANRYRPATSPATLLSKASKRGSPKPLM
ncbi:excisionase [Pseudomonas sp. TH31]|uniref:excisionase n=1 Tax=Pseudomonas sp. TH31 TaxID=2796396 RepID=UPI001911B0E9|nr:excisionase [Pseudomonas sp. TH31]MBK5415593.1 excisionase [Pseudomonas sp. TH31]